jgi:hypothetical protein
MKEQEIVNAPNPRRFRDVSPDPKSDARLESACDDLQRQGIRCAIIHYEGSGDQGAVERIEYLPDTVIVPEPLDDALSEVTANYCPDGYENNEGGYGTLTIFPAKGLAELEHIDRFTDVEPMRYRPATLPVSLHDRLARLGVKSVAAYFDGGSDDGQIEELTVKPTSVKLTKKLKDELEDFLLRLLPAGWDTGGGGLGDFMVDVTKASVEIAADSRIEQSSEPIITRWKWRK